MMDQKTRFKEGTKVLLKDYTLYEDYLKHAGEECTIKRLLDRTSSLDYVILWKDRDTSHVAHDNIIEISREWDEEENL